MPENRLQVVKGLEDVEVSECDSCSFEVTLNLAYIEGVWTRDGIQLKSKPQCRISTHGKKHSLILNRVALGDAGLFSFQANGIQTSGRLSVRGKLIGQTLLLCVCLTKLSTQKRLGLFMLSSKVFLSPPYVFMSLI